MRNGYSRQVNTPYLLLVLAPFFWHNSPLSVVGDDHENECVKEETMAF